MAVIRDAHVTRVQEPKTWGDMAKMIRVLTNNFNLLDQQVFGPHKYSYSLLTATGPVKIDDEIILGDATSGTVDIELPPATDFNRRTLILKRIDAIGGNDVNVVSYSTEEIDGSNTPIILASMDTLTIFSDGTAWWTI